jgi:hypothetical protein
VVSAPTLALTVEEARLVRGALVHLVTVRRLRAAEWTLLDRVRAFLGEDETETED